MSDESLYAIVNPAAGGGRSGRMYRETLGRLEEAGVRVEAVETRAPGHARELAAMAHAAGHRDFVAVGGDGTAFEILNGLLPRALEDRDDRISLGFLPLGTGNSFLRDFSERGADHAIEALRQGRRRQCDVIRLDYEGGVLHYINILSYGFVADVASLANRRFKSLGSAGYGLGVVAEVANLHTRTVRLRLDGGRWWEQEAIFVAINNSRFTGGKMEMAPYADTCDGYVDVVVVGRMGRLELLRAFPKIFAGTHVHLSKVTVTRARHIEVETPSRVDLMIDGEVLREQPTCVQVLPAAIDVRV